jgi:hypothetical protein
MISIFYEGRRRSDLDKQRNESAVPQLSWSAVRAKKMIGGRMAICREITVIATN